MPNNYIDSIRLSGTTYQIQGSGGGGTQAIELTQAQYDALVDKDPNVFYIITDAEAGDLTNYYTKTETNTLLGGKQATLVSGTNIKTINNESLLGSGNIDIQGGGSITVDTELSTTSENPVQNKVVTAALNGKGDALQWDLTSTARKNIPLRLMRGSTILSEQPLNLGDYLQYGSPTSSALCITGLTPTTDFTTHTADTTVHVTSTEKAAWNAKSDFSGDYNDLTSKPTIPTVPTSNTAFTNDAGYITIDTISGKVDTSTYNTYTAATDTALASKQTTLTAGTGISIVDNVISATGGGGGKAVSGGTNISITTGETADTINCTIPAFFHRDTVKGDINIGLNSGVDSNYGRLVIGRRVQSRGNPYFEYSIGIGVPPSTNSSDYNELYGSQSIGIGGFKIGNGSQYANFVSGCVAIGYGAKTRINNAVAIGKDTEASGTTKTNINNQLTIDTSNQVYISNSANTSTYCLQEKIENTEAALGGLKLVKLSQSEYDSLATKDNSTLYVIIN